MPRSAREEFKPAQQRALAALNNGHQPELTRGAYQELCGVSRSQAAYDLAELVEAGALERVGGGRSTRYVLVREPNSSRRHWTSERIRAELRHFCSGRAAWPSAREFKTAGHTDLYVAASRYGGVAYWADQLGLARAGRRWEAPSLSRLRLSLSWGMVGALGGALAVGAAVVIVQGLPGGTPKAVAEHAGSATTARTQSAQNSTRRAQKPAKHATTAKSRVVHRTRPSSAAAKRSSPSGSSTSTTAILATRTVSSSPPAPASSVSNTTASGPVRTATTSSSTASSGPTPLMAPRAGSSTPPPLPPPTH